MLVRSTRRLFLHDSIYDGFVAKLKAAYASVGVGNPLEGEVLVGPLIDRAAFEMMQETLAAARAAGGIVHGGARVGAGRSEEHTSELQSLMRIANAVFC